VSRQLISALETLADKSSEEIARAWKEEAVAELSGNAEELTRYLSDVEQSDDDVSYEWRINHPTAKQYEMGGTIFHTYDEAKRIGWTRDEFYETLEDCQEVIPRQRYTMLSAIRIKRIFEK
jgi:hypothetical protein